MIAKYKHYVFNYHFISEVLVHELEFLEHFHGTDKEFFTKYTELYPALNVRIFHGDSDDRITSEIREWVITNRENQIDDLLH